MTFTRCEIANNIIVSVHLVYLIRLVADGKTYTFVKFKNNDICTLSH